MVRITGYLLILLGAVLLATMPAHAQPSEWAIPITVTDESGATHELSVDIDWASVDLYHGAEKIDSVGRNNRTVEEVAEVAKNNFNATIRARFNIKRDPANHPIDGDFYVALIAAMCWNPETSQFIDPKPVI